MEIALTYDDVVMDRPPDGWAFTYLVGVDAHIRLLQDGEIIFEERSFTVVELAHALLAWLNNEDRADFLFESCDAEEVGIFLVRAVGDQWVIGSVWVEDVAGPAPWETVEAVLRGFIDQVRQTLKELGADPDWVLR